MNLNEAKQLKHNDEVTDYKRKWTVGISPSFPKVLHFWIRKTQSHTIDLDKPTTENLQFISKIEKL